MALYAVTYEHPDEAGWQAQLAPHIAYLQDLLAEGVLLASGPFPDRPVKSALLLLKAEDRPALDAIIARDPFAEHGLIDAMTITEWDPIFGVFNPLSSLPGRLQTRS